MAKQTNKITVLDLGAKPTNHLVSTCDGVDSQLEAKEISWKFS